MASGDKIQVVLEAQDEISGKITGVRRSIRDLESEQKRAAVAMEAGVEGAEDAWESLRHEVVRNKAELVRLGQERSALTRKARELAAEERKAAEAARVASQRAVDAAQRQRVSLDRVARAARGVAAGYDRVAGKLGLARSSSERLDASLRRLDDGATTFREKWVAAIGAVERKMAGFHPKTPGATGGTTTAAAASSGGAGALMGGVTAGSIAGGAAGGLVAGVGILATGAAVKGLQTSSALEQSELALEQMLGSAEKAQRMLEWIKATSARTPFELQGLTLSTQQMLGFGFSAKDAQENLLTLGDAAAATGKGQEGLDALTRALGQMQAKQKITGEEMMQLTEAGIPGWQLLADQMGVTVGELMDMSATAGGGKALFDMGGLDKLLAGMSEKYGGLMEKQADTFAGAQSNLMDTIGTGMADTLEEAGIMTFFKNLMQWVSQKLPVAFEMLRPLINDWAALFKDAWPVVRPVLMGIGGIIMKVTIPALRILFKVTGAALRFIASVADRVSRIWNGVGDFFRGLGRVFITVFDRIKSAFTSWTEAIRTAINTVIGWVNKIPGIEIDLIGAPAEVDGALWAGGPMSAGTYLVGEAGPELVVPDVGAPFMVGQGGMEIRDLPSGVMVPNHLLDAVPVAGPASSGGVHVGTLVVRSEQDVRRELEAMAARDRRRARELV